MDSSFVMPFIRSTANVFETMLKLKVGVGEPTRKHTGESSNDVSGIIGMSGDVSGSIVLSFPRSTARRVVALFAGVELEPEHPDFADAVGELVNMISGGAKAQFNTHKVNISCPSVVMGAGHIIATQKLMTAIVLHCSCDCGDFQIEIAIRHSDATQSVPTGECLDRTAQTSA